MNLCKQCKKPIPPTRVSMVVSGADERDKLVEKHNDPSVRVTRLRDVFNTTYWRVSWEDGRPGGFMERGDFHSLNCAALFGQSAMEEIRSGDLVASAKRKRRRAS